MNPILVETKNPLCAQKAVQDAMFLDAVHFPCGGKKTCKKCKIIITGDVSPLSAEEKEILSDSEINAHVRLACFVTIFSSAQIYFLPSDDFFRMTKNGIIPDFPLQPTYKNFALAIDIGTTTVIAALCTTSQIKPIKTSGVKNPQSIFGADIISRINSALQGNAQSLSFLILHTLDLLIQEVIQGICPANNIDFVIITGNSAMLYLLTGENSEGLAFAPFFLQNPFDKTFSAKNLSRYGCLQSLLPETPIYLPACISPFVGADISTGMLAAGFLKNNYNAKPSLFIDLGTNSEMILCCKNNVGDRQFLSCTAAAGPVFEGMGILMGTQGIKGAIEQVQNINGRIYCSIIGQDFAVGICGSAIIDALAVFLQIGIIDKNGTINPNVEDYKHLICRMQDSLSCILHENPTFADSSVPKTIIITQQDIRVIQTAKAAICAGIQTLLFEAELVPSQIDSLYLAGGFGSFINLQNAANIGLIPKELASKTTVIGNAALAGTQMLLQNSNFFSQIKTACELFRHIDLAQNPHFTQIFLENMTF